MQGKHCIFPLDGGTMSGAAPLESVSVSGGRELDHHNELIPFSINDLLPFSCQVAR